MRKLEIALEQKNELLQKLYDMAPLDPAAVAEEVLRHAERLRPFIADTSLLVNRALDAGKRVLFEGAQGTHARRRPRHLPVRDVLQPDRGRGLHRRGCRPDAHRRGARRRQGLRHARRRGARSPPSSTTTPGDTCCEQGHEFGTTTGRQRRCGWLDLVALRYAVRLSGITEIALTKLDVLSGLDTLKVCVAYETKDEERLGELPDNQTIFHGCRPVYEEIPGWDEDITTCTELEDLPPRARKYVDLIADALGVPITLIGTGQGRHQVIDFVGI